jgi:hypothetical protein
MRATILFIILCAGSGFPVLAQTLSHHVVSPAGDVDRNDRIELAWTLGEIAVSGKTQLAESITEGFHQPIIRVERVDDDFPFQNTAPDITVYPNPTNHALHVRFDKPATGNWQFILTTADGAQVSQHNQSTGRTDATLDVSSLPAGMYFLLLRSEDKAQQHQYKITRIQ